MTDILLIYNYCFQLTKIIQVGNLQTVCNMKPKLMSQIISPGSRFSILGPTIPQKICWDQFTKLYNLGLLQKV